MSITKDQIIEAVGAMSIIDVAELVTAMEKKFGVSAYNAISTTGISTTNNVDTEEKTEFDVILKSTGMNKVAVIKAVRSVTSLGLKEAKDLVESAPIVLKEGVNKDEAQTLKKSLEEVGAEIEVQ